MRMHYLYKYNKLETNSTNERQIERANERTNERKKEGESKEYISILWKVDACVKKIFKKKNSNFIL